MSSGRNDFGLFLEKEMQERGWSQKDLSEVTGISVATVSKIINEGKGLTDENICAIAYSFDVTPEYLRNVEFRFRMKKNPDTRRQEFIKLKSACKDIAPLNEMHKKGWIDDCSTLNGVRNALEYLYDTSDIAELRKPEIKYVARQTRFDEKLTLPYCNAWFSYARKIAGQFRNKIPYRRDRLINLANKIVEYTKAELGIEKFLEELRQCGVSFFVLEHLQKTYLDGAAFVIDDSPFIVYTGRYDRLDNFWFVLAHEIAHVILHFERLRDGIIDSDLDKNPNSDIEQEADSYAEKMLHKSIVMAKVKEFPNTYFSSSRMNYLSKETGLCDSIIMGFLAHDGIIDYRIASKYTKRSVISDIPKEYFAMKSSL